MQQDVVAKAPRLTGLAVTLLLSSAAVHVPLQSQGRIAARVITGGASCSLCRVTWSDSVQLVVPAQQNAGRVERIVIDGRGHLWLFRAGDVPLKYARDGSPLGAVGRLGRGPGEMLQAYDALAVHRDTVVVFDGNGRRALVFGPAGEAVRELRLSLEPHSPLILRWPDKIIASGSLLTPEAAGKPLHLLSLAGTAVTAQRSMAYGPELLRPQGPPLMWHELARSARGGYWAAWRYGYTLTRWSGDGELLESMQRRVPWFEEGRVHSVGNHSTPPSTEIVHVFEDGNRWLWVFSRRASPNWQRAWQHVPRGVAEVPMRTIDLDLLYEGVVEVLDTASGTVLFSGPIPQGFVSGLGDGRVAFGQERADGGLVVSVRRPVLLRR